MIRAKVGRIAACLAAVGCAIVMTASTASAASSSYQASNSFGTSSGTKSWSSRQYVRVSGTIRDHAANPSTSYAYLSWEQYHHGAWTKENKQVGRATNGSSGSVSGSFNTPYDVRNVKVTVCTSAGGWYCGSPG
ncbi:hypothetical protein ACQPZF_22545 [Actinosynnema sp. CS-041913]|uniref:hypothetical protein n=1 Tax=Actinosynnema sp. CS-041913 TaxID=3239917 RepID=UPI003D8D66CD